MTKVVFETATFADVVKKADKVAPSKGTAFDKAAGVLIEVNPDQDPAVVIRATNLDVFYREWVDTVAVEGEPRQWRVPSALLATFVSSLPIGSGLSITLEEVQAAGSHYPHLVIKSGKTKARFNLMSTEFYPDWDVFDPDDLVSINDLGGRISQVEWAAEKSPNPPLNALYFDGSCIIATDRYRLARVPLAIPSMLADSQVVVPAGLLGTVLKQTGEVKIGFTQVQMLLMPNETTQLRVVRYDAKYPNVSKVMVTERPQNVEVSKLQILEIMRRATAFSGAERMPTVRMFFGKEQIAVVMDNPDVGAMQDVLDVPGSCLHDRVEIKFTPRNLMEAIENSPGERIKICYNPETPQATMYLVGDSGYEAWVVTRGESQR